MNSLIRFNELKADANIGPISPRQDESIPVSSVIEHIRQRLTSRDYGDSVEVKVALLGELVYQCYRETIKRRYL